MGYIFHSHTWSALSRKLRNLLPQENVNLSNIFTSVSLIWWTLGYHPSSKQSFLKHFWREGNAFSCVCLYWTSPQKDPLPQAMSPAPVGPLTLLDRGPPLDMFKLIQLGPHCTWTPDHPATPHPTPMVGKRAPHIPTGMFSCLWYTSILCLTLCGREHYLLQFFSSVLSEQSSLPSQRYIWNRINKNAFQ